MLALLISGLYLLLQERERASGALIVTAVAVKLTAGLVLPFALARGARKRPTDAGRRALLVGVGTAAGIVAFLTFVVFGTGPLRLLRTLHDVQSRGACTASPGCC